MVRPDTGLTARVGTDHVSPGCDRLRIHTTLVVGVE